MAELRFGRRWRPPELRPHLADLDHRTRNFGARRLEDMTPEHGWHPEFSEQVTGHEPPGPPLPDDVFERTRIAVANYEFSDPTIVRAHVAAGTPLLDRRMLLEIQVLGLRYLCGVVVSAVEWRRDEDATTWGYRYDTLDGHIEAGSEWFEVTKDHATGEVRFRIYSRWRRGQFPNWWSRVGFMALAPYYRNTWLRRAHERLRALIQQPVAELQPPPEPIAVTTPPTERLPEVAPEPASRARTLGVAAALGAVSGMRSLSAPALMAARSAYAGPQPHAGRTERAAARPGVAALLATGAVAELIADKHPRIPARTTPPALAGRITMGALASYILAKRWRQSPKTAALTGAATAALSTVTTYHLRRALQRRTRLPSPVLGALEDTLTLTSATLLWRHLRHHAPTPHQRHHLHEPGHPAAHHHPSPDTP